MLFNAFNGNTHFNVSSFLYLRQSNQTRWSKSKSKSKGKSECKSKSKSMCKSKSKSKSEFLSSRYSKTIKQYTLFKISSSHRPEPMLCTIYTP